MAAREPAEKRRRVDRRARPPCRSRRCEAPPRRPLAAEAGHAKAETRRPLLPRRRRGTTAAQIDEWVVIRVRMPKQAIDSTTNAPITYHKPHGEAASSTKGLRSRANNPLISQDHRRPVEPCREHIHYTNVASASHPSGTRNAYIKDRPRAKPIFSGVFTMPVRQAQAVWEGTVKEGKGTITLERSKLQAPYGFVSRFEEQRLATNPEELIARGACRLFLHGAARRPAPCCRQRPARRAAQHQPGLSRPASAETPRHVQGGERQGGRRRRRGRRAIMQSHGNDFPNRGRTSGHFHSVRCVSIFGPKARPFAQPRAQAE